MSQSKLEKVLPLIQSAAKIFIDEDGISESEEYETKAFCQQFTVKAIMSSGFNIGKSETIIHFRAILQNLFAEQPISSEILKLFELDEQPHCSDIGGS